MRPVIVHRSVLNDVAVDALLQGDVPTAGQSLHVLVGQPTGVPSELLWASVEVLRGHQRADRHVSRVYQHVLTQPGDPAAAAAVMLEYGLFLLQRGQPQEAYEHLAARVYQPPHNTNPLLHGYCGAIAYSLWQAEQQQQHQQQHQGSSSSSNGSSYANTQLALALGHFDKYARLCTPMDAPVPMDAAFVDMQAELLVSAQRRPEAVRAVQLFVSLCPNDPLGPRLLLKYQEGAEDQDPTQLTPVQLLHRALELDPCAPNDTVFLPLVRHYQLSQSFPALARLLCDRIDYRPRDLDLWQSLALVLERLDGTELRHLAGHVSYWNEMHFSEEAVVGLAPAMRSARAACRRHLVA